MKHIETSKLIKLTSGADAAAIKYSLVQRLRGVFHVETVGEGNESFTLTALGKGTPYHCNLNVLLKADSQKVRLIIDGELEINASTKIFYVLGLLAILILGLFRESSVNTTGHGTAMDILVFLFLGLFILHDINKKLEEPQALLDRVLKSIDTEFSA